MNKSLPIIILVLLLLLGGGAYLTFQKGTIPPALPGSNMVPDKSQGGGVFDSIKDALTKSLSLECAYQDEKGVETTTFIKGGAIRVDAKTTIEGKDNYSQVIFKDRRMYSWDPTSKKGMTFEIPEEAAQSATGQESETNVDKEQEFFKEIEKYKNSCKAASVSDSLFVPPSDVTFEDFNQMMKGVMKDLPQNNKAPSFDLEELKKQYGVPDDQ